jgi:hypothetical protein
MGGVRVRSFLGESWLGNDAHRSIVCNHAASEISLRKNIPVGIVQTAVGGTSIDLWTAPAGALYLEKISPLVNFVINGVVWYQGEKDSSDYRVYASKLGDFLTKTIHANFGMIPVYVIDLAGFRGRFFARLRVAQREGTRGYHNVYHVSALDLGSYNNVHPRGKDILGARVGNYYATGFYDEPQVEWYNASSGVVKFDRDVIVKKSQGYRRGMKCRPFGIHVPKCVFLDNRTISLYGRSPSLNYANYAPCVIASATFGIPAACLRTLK